MNILVAEDDEDIANLHRLIIESRNHTVVLALDGQQCIDAYRQTRRPFESVVLDYKMPVLDGIQVAKEILSRNPRQRIIIATGQVKETLYDSIQELGQIIEIILKPFEPELLVEVIEDTLASARVKELDATAKTTYNEKDLDSQIDKLLHKLKTIQRQGTL